MIAVRPAGEGISVSDAVREAIAEHIARKREDEAFWERLRAVVERDREILERLVASRGRCHFLLSS